MVTYGPEEQADSARHRRVACYGSDCNHGSGDFPSYPPVEAHSLRLRTVNLVADPPPAQNRQTGLGLLSLGLP
jgi:hypothetical protein